MKTPPEAMALVLVASFIGSFGAVFLKLGAARLKLSWLALVANWRLLAGVALFVLSSVFFVAGVSRGELTVLYPMVSLSYVWTLLWSRLFFREPITPTKVCGVGLILVGVACIGWGNRV